MSLVLYQILICPFCQRVQIILSLKQVAVRNVYIDGVAPRPKDFLELTDGSQQCPVLQIDNLVLKESIVIMEYIDEAFDGCRVRRTLPHERAIENMIISKEGVLFAAGVKLLLNQDLSARQNIVSNLLEVYSMLNSFLVRYAKGDEFLFEDFGFAEAVFAPLFLRLTTLSYYEDFELPDTPLYARVRKWIVGCLNHKLCQTVSREEVIKSYYDYSIGFGKGSLPPGRKCSSLSTFPSWKFRPYPPRDKYHVRATDEELGLV